MILHLTARPTPALAVLLAATLLAATLLAATLLAAPSAAVLGGAEVTAADQLEAADEVTGGRVLDPVTAAELLEHVEFLAADALEGREAGTRGERLAAGYIVSMLEEIDGIEPAGVDGTWFQDFLLPGPDQAVARNIMAILPGSDPDLAHQTIIIGAHYDHVGQHGTAGALDGRLIHNGADDNASGTAGVLELAEALATAPQRPRRTIMFQLYSGEEKGLVGSVYYTKNPLRPLQDTLLMVNMDMIGRLVHGTLLVGGTGTAPGLPEICADAAAAHGLTMIEEPVGGAPSDNASFHVAGVPALFLFTGVHEDYHRAGDDSHKINDAGMAAVVGMAHQIVATVDGNDERTTFTLAPGAADHWGPTPFFGAVYGRLFESGLGSMQVDMIFEGSPAEAAGLAVGDVVLAVEGETIRRASGFLQLRTAQSLDARLDRKTNRFTPMTLTVLRPRAPGDTQGATGGDAAGRFEIVIEPVVK